MEKPNSQGPKTVAEKRAVTSWKSHHSELAQGRALHRSDDGFLIRQKPLFTKRAF
jgi:hypothetical protein